MGCINGLLIRDRIGRCIGIGVSHGLLGVRQGEVALTEGGECLCVVALRTCQLLSGSSAVDTHKRFSGLHLLTDSNLDLGHNAVRGKAQFIVSR